MNMKSKNFLLTEETEDTRFLEGLKGIQDFNDTLPVVSSTDKKGNKLSKTVAALLLKAIEVLPKLKGYLKGNFVASNIVDNKAKIESLQLKISAMLVEVKRMEAAIVVIGIHIDADYRQIYEAIKEAADDDVSLKDTRDQLGAPYAKASKADETTAAAPTAVAAAAA
jgi:hypothetical protein